VCNALLSVAIRSIIAILLGEGEPVPENAVRNLSFIMFLSMYSMREKEVLL
jgi:hypothetical protein